MSKPNEEIVVVGAGPAGMAAALALSQSGCGVLLVALDEGGRSPDRRTTALLGGSVQLLKNIGVWPALASRSAPLAGIRIVDDRRGLLRAPELTFHAAELGLPDFGQNVENSDLVDALLRKAAQTPGIRRLDGSVSRATCHGTHVTLAVTNGAEITTRLVIAADGRNSLIRKSAGIEVDTWSYPQSALAVSFSHSRTHGYVSTELHRRHGPLTSVPLPGRDSSLVWVEAPETAKHLAALPDTEFQRLLAQELQGLLGDITRLGHRGVFPLSGLTARRLGCRRVALVGEAAHVMPPVGAQGLNLGLRDAGVIADIVAAARRDGSDPGGDVALEHYHRNRIADVLSRQISVDVLNRSLLSDFLPMQALRGAGLHLLAHFGPLRAAVMRAGLGPGALPALMREAS